MKLEMGWLLTPLTLYKGLYTPRVLAGSFLNSQWKKKTVALVYLKCLTFWIYLRMEKQKIIYILDDSATLCCGCVDDDYLFLKTTVSALLSVIIFTCHPFPHSTIMGARAAHKRQLFISDIPETMIRPYCSIIFTCHHFQPWG